MDLNEGYLPLTEDVILYIISLLAKQRGSQVFFKISHNISLARGWHFWCTPDLDLVEVLQDATIIAYEVKGQRKGKHGYNWPALHSGLDQALTYLTLPKVTNDSPYSRMFNGGVVDFVYLVHPLDSEDVQNRLDLKVISLTPVGYMGVLPVLTTGNPQGVESEGRPFTVEQLNKVIEIVPARPNPLKDELARTFFLENLDSLQHFGERSRTFKRRVEPAGMAYFGNLKKP